MHKRKSWQKKLTANKGLPRVETITRAQSRRWGTGTVLIEVTKRGQNHFIADYEPVLLSPSFDQ